MVIFAAGKAAGSMAESAEAHYRALGLGPDRLSGLAIARHGYGRPLTVLDALEAGIRCRMRRSCCHSRDDAPCRGRFAG